MWTHDVVGELCDQQPHFNIPSLFMIPKPCFLFFVYCPQQIKEFYFHSIPLPFLYPIYPLSLQLPMYILSFDHIPQFLSPIITTCLFRSSAKIYDFQCFFTIPITLSRFFFSFRDLLTSQTHSGICTFTTTLPPFFSLSYIHLISESGLLMVIFMWSIKEVFFAGEGCDISGFSVETNEFFILFVRNRTDFEFY